LHASDAPHLLHVVSLDDASGSRPELIVPVAPEWARGIRCAAGTIAVRGDTARTEIRVDASRWRVEPGLPAPMSASSAPWQTTRLWGTGAWTLPATQSVTLRHFQPSGRVAL